MLVEAEGAAPVTAAGGDGVGAPPGSRVMPVAIAIMPMNATANHMKTSASPISMADVALADRFRKRHCSEHPADYGRYDFPPVPPHPRRGGSGRNADLKC